MNEEQQLWLNSLYQLLNQAPEHFRFSIVDQSKLRPVVDIQKLKNHEKAFINPQLDLELRVVSKNQTGW